MKRVLEFCDLLIRHGRIITHETESLNESVESDIAIRDGKIIAVGKDLNYSSYDERDVSNLHIMPGVIDTHVHFREPGMEHKEDLYTGSMAAVKGGVTSVFEMPNTIPVTATYDALEDKLKRAKGRMFSSYAFYIAATMDNIDLIPDLELLPGVAGIKIFYGLTTNSSDLWVTDSAVEEILRKTSRRVSVHSEDNTRLISREPYIIKGDVSSHSVWRDKWCALESTKRLLDMADSTQAKMHILHVSTLEEIEMINAYNNVTCEVTPHHMFLSVEDYLLQGSKVQVNPPIRSLEISEAVRHEVCSGNRVDILGSDHAPHLLAEKVMQYPGSPSGMPGVQTLLPLGLDLVSTGVLSPGRLVSLTSLGPSHVFGIDGKGMIDVGYDADLAIVDFGKRNIISSDWISSKSCWSPYEGRMVRGWPEMTVVNGKIAMEGGEITGAPCGDMIYFS
mgnify:CR=1 FL=1